LESFRSTKAEKCAQAILLRDAALGVVKRIGAWQTASPVKLLSARVGSLLIGYRTPFQRLPVVRDKLKFIAAKIGAPPPQSLPYGLDLWAPKKVLNVEWDDQGNVALIGFRRGEWEEELIAAAKWGALSADELVD
jgi:hypothetical protein